MNLTMAEAKKDFERGLLQGFDLTDSPLLGGWVMTFRAEGMSAPFLVDARTKNARTFKTLDAAVRAAREIGFQAEFLLGGR